MPPGPKDGQRAPGGAETAEETRDEGEDEEAAGQKTPSPTRPPPPLAATTTTGDGFLNTGTIEPDSDAEEAPSISAFSRYPTVAHRHRVEHPFDSDTLNSSSRSLYADDLDYVYENGRRYCGSYTFPNDELEQDRMRVVHQVFLHLFDLELSTVPLDNPSHILDVGTGTGEWAIGMGESYANCEVVGVDISAIQPTAVPHNVFFEVDNCELEWMRPADLTDLVHMRNLAGAFSDWDFVYRQAFACLKPGGAIEVLDFCDATGPGNFYDRFPPESELHFLMQQLDEGTIRAGRRRGTHHMDPRLLEDAGYVDVQVRELSIPLSPRDNSLGKLWLIACLHGLEAGSLRVLTKYMGWDPDRARASLDRICDDFKALAMDPNRGDDFAVGLKVLTARKPLVPGYCTAQSVPETGNIVDFGRDDSTIGSSLVGR